MQKAGSRASPALTNSELQITNSFQTLMEHSYRPLARLISIFPPGLANHDERKARGKHQSGFQSDCHSLGKRNIEAKWYL